MSRRSVHEIRFGMVKVLIWQNQTKSGERHNVTAVRLFRNGDVWQESVDAVGGGLEAPLARHRETLGLRIDADHPDRTDPLAAQRLI